jgi:hypothetical protein
MLNLEKGKQRPIQQLLRSFTRHIARLGWNSNTKKKTSRKSFGNVFTAAIEEDERRLELERRILQEGDGATGGAPGVAPAWGLSGSSEAPDGSPLPTEDSKRV